VISVSIFVAMAAGTLLWREVDTQSHDVAVQAVEPRNASPVINPVPGSQDSPLNLPASPNAIQPDSDGEHRRLNRFFLDRYYPDLQKETDFDPDDVDKLVSLKNSDEADLEQGLGAAKYRRWKEYEGRVQSGEVVSKLGMALPGDDQLTEGEADLLRRTIFDERRRRDEELRIRTYVPSSDLRSRLEFESVNLEIKEESDRRLLAAASVFLSERQFAALPEAVTDPNQAKTRAELQRVRARLESRTAQ
jgi:hypothetical protein